MTESLRWGILGTGGIAKKFASQNQQVEHGQLVAVASRAKESAEAFASQYGGTGYAGYQQLLNDDSVDAIYISLPNSMHCEWTIRALEAGKHVLCEKPIASNTAEAEQMFAVAEQQQRVLVEAFMYRCHPSIERFIELARGGAVGEIRLIRSHFTFNRPENRADVRYQADLAGGSLMDVGCYPINFTRAIVGSEPTATTAMVHKVETGVDSYAAGCMQFGDGPLSTFTCGMCVTADRTTFVGGSEGYMAIDTPWIPSGTFRIVRGDEIEQVTVGKLGDQYALEAKVFADVVSGSREPWITAADTIGNMRCLDQLRAVSS